MARKSHGKVIPHPNCQQFAGQALHFSLTDFTFTSPSLRMPLTLSPPLVPTGCDVSVILTGDHISLENQLIEANDP